MRIEFLVLSLFTVLYFTHIFLCLRFFSSLSFSHSLLEASGQAHRRERQSSLPRSPVTRWYKESIRPTNVTNFCPRRRLTLTFTLPSMDQHWAFSRRSRSSDATREVQCSGPWPLLSFLKVNKPTCLYWVLPGEQKVVPGLSTEVCTLLG